MKPQTIESFFFDDCTEVFYIAEYVYVGMVFEYFIKGAFSYYDVEISL